MKRIGLTQRVITIAGTHERRDSLDQQWAKLLVELGLVPVPLPNLIKDVEGYLTSLELDGVILTGGGDIVGYASDATVTPERDRMEHALIEYSSAQGLPVLGVCRGLQALVNHYGGKLSPVDGHVAVRHSVRFADGFISGAELPADVNSYHDFGINESGLPDILEACVWSEDQNVEGVSSTDRRIIGIMWHPEREDRITPMDRALILKLFGDSSQ
jgi:N5-(cytidine 5'-diphosphoramidyl)-L-glutamine hydrolase